MDQEIAIPVEPHGFPDPVDGSIGHAQSVVLASPTSSSGDYSRYTAGHRIADVIFALILLVVFSPLIVGVVTVLLCSGGPILFRHKRLGLHGVQFHVYKFRTMVPNAAEVLRELLDKSAEARMEWEREAKLKNDPRVTPIGRFLRRTSLDELPQLFNILRGDMSLVGPRPVEPAEISKYGRYARHYFAQRPGLTGLWQVSGRNDCSYQRRIALDAYYARNRSIGLDLSIIIKTVRVVLTGRGAY
jgi:undecaprenyl-phosphate galactose phosphotransferase